MGLTAMVSAYGEGTPWMAALMDDLSGNLALALASLAALAPRVLCPRPESTYLLWLDHRGLGLSDPELQQRLIDAGLGLSPGTQFGPEGSGFMRINFALPRAVLMATLCRLTLALDPAAPVDGRGGSGVR